MTLPAGGNSPPISLADLNAEYGYGLNLGAYIGKLIGNGASVKLVPASSITLSGFYGTNKIVSGGPNAVGTGNFTVPQYKTMTFWVQGGQAGFAGAAGVYQGGPASGSATAPSDGSPGGTTFFNGIVQSNGGAPNGNYGTPQQVVLTNPAIPGGTGPASGTLQYSEIGGGGAGGQGGPIMGWTGSVYVQVGNAATGSPGGSGSANISWTGEP